MTIVAQIAAKFNSYYSEKPLLTTMVTNAVLGGVADTVAQLITAVKALSTRIVPVGEDDLILIKASDQDKERNPSKGELRHAENLPASFDFKRVTRFMSYGFIMAPIQFKWFGFLSRAFPHAKKNSTVPVLKRVAFDQFIFAPFGLACFFSFMAAAEGGSKEALAQKFCDVYLPTLRANYMLWPAVQIINFRVIPLQFQIPFVSSVGIAWTAYLSLTNSSDDT